MLRRCESSLPEHEQAPITATTHGDGGGGRTLRIVESQFRANGVQVFAGFQRIQQAQPAPPDRHAIARIAWRQFSGLEFDLAS